MQATKIVSKFCRVNKLYFQFYFKTWYEDAAVLAQSWADECKRLTHNRPVDQVYGNCGQNIFISTAPTSWYERTFYRKQRTAPVHLHVSHRQTIFFQREDVVKDWHSEVRDFTYGGDNNFQDTGHYTQVVWATSNKVGCGLAKCKDSQGRFFNYICNYCPT